MLRGTNRIIFILLIAFLATACRVIGIMTEYKADREVYRRIRDAAVTDAGNPLDRKVDFTIPASAGCRAVSWLYIPGTKIDYPLVQGADNETYLTMDAYGNPSKAGAIFLNCENDPCLEDPKSIVFGHNMKDGSMFHDLGKYRDESYAKSHPRLYIYHANGTIAPYDLLYTLTTIWQDSIYTVSSSDTVEKIDMDLAGRADAVYGNTGKGKLVVLSTCIKGDQRYVCIFQEAGETVQERREAASSRRN